MGILETVKLLVEVGVEAYKAGKAVYQEARTQKVLDDKKVVAKKFVFDKGKPPHASSPSR